MAVTREALTDRDLMRTLKVTRSVFYRLKKEGKFRGFECRPQLTKMTRYSPVLVERWVHGGSAALERIAG